MAITVSPTTILLESPKEADGRFVLSILSTAMSVMASAPTTSASYSSPSPRTTKIWSAPSITWLFVTIIPPESIMTPEPVFCVCRTELP